MNTTEENIKKLIRLAHQYLEIEYDESQFADQCHDGSKPFMVIDCHESKIHNARKKGASFNLSNLADLTYNYGLRGTIGDIGAEDRLGLILDPEESENFDVALQNTLDAMTRQTGDSQQPSIDPVAKEILAEKLEPLENPRVVQIIADILDRRDISLDTIRAEQRGRDMAQSKFDDYGMGMY